MKARDLLEPGVLLQGVLAREMLDGEAVLAAGTRVGVYKVIREIGRGGMGVVYLAERDDGEFRQHVALKLVADRSLSREVFKRERQILADLSHPHIARLVDGGQDQRGRPWLAMELIEGDRLDRHCVAAALPQRERLNLFLDVCSAVQFAHSRGVLHRDLKPANVMVDRDGSARLLDFGIAELMGDERSLVQAFTPGYASPEQMRGEVLTVASDVFQLGRLLRALLASDEGERRTLLGEAEPAVAQPSPETRVLPADLAAIIGHACAADPGDRYASVAALAEDLRRYLTRRPVNARPRTRRYIAQRYVQRHPFAVGMVAAVLLLMASVVTGFTLELKSERDLAQRERDKAEAINRFLNDDLLQAANPMRRAPGEPEVTVRAALDSAAAQVADRFEGQPEVARALLMTLGRLRYEFGEYELALANFDAAAAIEAGSAQDAVETALARAMAMLSLQRQDNAITLLQQLLPQARALLGPGHLETLRCELLLLTARARLNLEASVLPAFENLRLRAISALGEVNEVSAQVDLSVADHHRGSGRSDLAAEPARRAYAALSELRGVTHHSTLKAQIMLGHAYNAIGEVERALEMLRQAFVTQRDRYGSDDGDTLFMQSEYAFVLASHERFDEAEPLFAEAVRLWSQRWGAESMQIVPMMSNLANARTRLGYPDEAIAIVEQALGIMDRAEGSPGFMRVILYRVLVDALHEAGQLDAAAQAVGAGLAAADSAGLGASDLRRLALNGAHARLLLSRGDSEAEGAALLDTTVAEMLQLIDARHPLLRPLLRVQDERRQAAALRTP